MPNLHDTSLIWQSHHSDKVEVRGSPYANHDYRNEDSRHSEDQKLVAWCKRSHLFASALREDATISVEVALSSQSTILDDNKRRCLFPSLSGIYAQQTDLPANDLTIDRTSCFSHLLLQHQLQGLASFPTLLDVKADAEMQARIIRPSSLIEKPVWHGNPALLSPRFPFAWPPNLLQLFAANAALKSSQPSNLLYSPTLPAVAATRWELLHSSPPESDMAAAAGELARYNSECAGKSHDQPIFGRPRPLEGAGLEAGPLLAGLRAALSRATDGESPDLNTSLPSQEQLVRPRQRF
jgi:hypothetical protein